MNLGLKLSFLLLSLYLIIVSFFHTDSSKVSLSGWLIILFWLIYSVRIIYDTQVEGVIFRGNLFKFYAIAFGNCLIGAIATIRTVKYVNLRVANKAFFTTILLSCLSILATIYFLQGSINPAAIIGRARFSAEFSPGVEKDVLNPITISLYGELLALLSLANLALKKRHWLKNVLYISAFAIGVLVLILGASRGPVLGGFLGVLFCLGLFLRFRRKTSAFMVKIIVAPALLAFVFFQILAPRLENIDFAIVQRLSDLNEQLASGKKEVRDFQWASAWEQFLENPIVGDRYLERYADFYPHNVYLEAFMATGVIGSLFFFSTLLLSFFLAYKAFHDRQGHVLFFVLVLAVLVANFTSGSLFESIPFWILLAFWGGITHQQRKTFSLTS
jgi:O-antigen ligase